MHSTGFRPHARSDGSSPANDWSKYPDQIKVFVERLQGVGIENRDFADVLLQQDSKTTLHYIDPPYVHETRNMRRSNANYAHEFPDDEHKRLATVVHLLKGFVILSGYDCQMYEEFFGDFHKVQRVALADGAGKRIETLWMNFKPNQTNLFS
jgi:DNA adenine methylase